LTEIKTDDGLTGYGEIHGAPAARICDWVARFGEIIQGMDALGYEAVWDRLFALTSPRPGVIDGKDGLPPPVPRGERNAVMAAIAGIDIALWDLKGKAAGMPVWRLLGGANRPLFTYATGGYYRPGAPNSVYAEEMARLIELGYYRAVKLKTGLGGIAADVERVGLVRAAIGEAPELMLDMNAPYDLVDCIEFAHRVEPYRIFWLEEPLHWYLQPADFARLAAATPIPLAHGERELARFTVRDFIVEGGIRYVQFDATRAAGFTEALRIAALVEQLQVTGLGHDELALGVVDVALEPFTATRGVDADDRRTAQRAGDPRPSGAGLAARCVRGRVAWRRRQRPARPWAVPGISQIARRSSAYRRPARFRPRTGLAIRRAIPGIRTCTTPSSRAAGCSRHRSPAPPR
jgi:D-galactarolactone cycloisomerase